MNDLLMISTGFFCGACCRMAEKGCDVDFVDDGVTKRSARQDNSNADVSELGVIR